MLRAGLTDRSAKVRWKAAEHIERLEKRRLLPELASALAVETNNVTRSVMHDALRLPRDGSRLEPWAEGFQSLAARRREGGTVQLVSERVLQDRGIDSLVREHRVAAERLGGDQVPVGSRTPS